MEFQHTWMETALGYFFYARLKKKTTKITVQSSERLASLCIKREKLRHYGISVLRRALNWAPLCRETPVSQTADATFSSVGIQGSRRGSGSDCFARKANVF